MTTTETLEQTGEFLRLALRYMGERRIPVNPENYAVWYEYVSGNSAELKEVMDRYMASGREFTPEINRELYRKFVSGDKKEVTEPIYLEFRRILLEMLRLFAASGAEMARSSNHLERYIQELENETEINTICRTVGEIINETRSMVVSGKNLHERMQSGSREIEELRKALVREKERAVTDALTGVSNRRAFEEELDRQIARSRENQSPLSIMFTDIDLFKRINDQFGHLVGDKVLRMTASKIRQFVKGKDFVARYGGEEFVVLFPDTPLKGADVVSEQIRSGFEQIQWKRKDTGESLGKITISLGVTELRADDSGKDFLARADSALYESKNNGRNRVTSVP